jgi:hypothetical protein
VGVQDLQVVDDGFTRSCPGQEEKHMAHEEICSIGSACNLAGE